MTVPDPATDLPDIGPAADEAAGTVIGSTGDALADAFATTSDSRHAADPGDTFPDDLGEALASALALADARLVDLHRERAEFVNYRRRAERDIAMATAAGVAGLVEGLLPVLDDIRLARDHGDLGGTPFAAVADKLDATLSRFGVEVYGEPGDPFDPLIHEALLHEAVPAEYVGADGPICTRVLQPGYRLGERVLRPARVAVADPG